MTEVKDKSSMVMRGARSMACEFVTDGHPDKVCDEFADTIVDAAMEQDPMSRVAMEVTGGHGLVFVTGEMTTNAKFDIGELLRAKYKAIGHDHEIAVATNVVKQANEIKAGADRDGAGDQGAMTGEATDDGPNFMPRSWTLSRELCVMLRKLRIDGTLPWLRPDGKSLIAFENDVPTYVVIAAHHAKVVDGTELNPDDPESVKLVIAKIRAALIEHIVLQVLPGFDPTDVNCIINGNGTFEQGGFEADAGTTGRKLVVDNYGPNVEIGGGCYSGKDPSKVDRSAAYFCRYVAKAIVAGGHAPEAIVKTGYAIGMANPAFVSVETPLPADQAAALEAKVREVFDFRPKAIIERLGLRTPKGWRYQDAAAMGHYGDPRFPWEQVAQF